MSAPIGEGLYPSVPVDDYHADRASLSVSGAKLLMPPSCPAKFRYAQDNPQPIRKVWDFGHVAHRLVLGKGSEFVVLHPDVHGLKVDGTPADAPTKTKNWADHEASARAQGKIPIHIDEFERAQAMAAAVLEHPECGKWFQGQAEVSAYHRDPETGVRLRARVDMLGDDYITELKTSLTANPGDLERIFYKLKYHCQNAWYQDLFSAVTGRDLKFRFVVVEKEPPHVVTPIVYDDIAIGDGRRLNRQAIHLYKQCHDTGRWPGYSTGTEMISLPAWALDEVELKL